MKLLTFQPLQVLKELKKGNEFKADAINDYSDCSAENIALKKACGFDPIWCIPIFGDMYSLYNVMRCSPSFPQSAILIEKDFNKVVPINYVKYSECVRSTKITPDKNVDFKKCVVKLTENELKKKSAYYECVIPSIHPRELRGSYELSKSDDPDVLNSTLLDYLLSNRFKELIPFKYDLIWPENPLSNPKLTVAWRALTWHKLVDYVEMTEDTTRYSIDQFKQFCIKSSIR